MGLKSKSRLRLTVLMASIGAAAALGGGTYGILHARRTAEIQALKPQGLAAFKSGDLVQALHFLGPYVLRYPDDLEALEAYAKVRQQLPEPDGAEAQEAMGLYRQIVALKPESIADKCTLLDLYAQQNLNTEIIQEADEILAQLSARRPPPTPATPVAGSTEPAAADAAPMEQALREKAEALRHLRKMDDARKTAEALVAIDPLAPGSAEELFLVMSTAGDAPSAILARLATITAGRESDPQIMLLTARTFAAVHDFDHARTAGLAVAGKPLPSENMVLQLADLLDRLEEFSAADKVIDAGLAQFHSAALQDEHFRRLLYREQYTQADAELSKMDVSRRPTLAGLHIIALCELADTLQSRGDTPGAERLRQQAQAILPVLGDCALHWDNRAAGWHDVLELAYFSNTASQRELIDKSRDALSRDPGNAFFYFTLGNAYRRAGDDSAAIIQWRSAAALAPAWSGPLASAARYFISAGDPLQALDLAQKADRRLPGQKDTLVSIAIAWQKSLGAPNIPDADALLAFITDPAHQAVFGWDSDILPMEVWLKCQTHQTPAAEARANEAIENLPAANAAALLPLALACQQLKLSPDLPDRCFAAYEKLKGDDADVAFARCQLILQAAGSSSVATAAAAQAKALFAAAAGAHSREAPEIREPWDFAFCRLLEQLRDPAAAAAWKSLALANPKNNSVQWAALQASSMHADHAARGEILGRLQALTGDSGLSWRLQKGAWLLEDIAHSGNLDAALELLKQTAAMSPDSAAARELLGQALASAGRIPEALTELTKAADLDPRNMQTRLNMGRLYLSQGDKVRAIAQLRRVTEETAAPGDQRKNAAILLAQAGDMDSAMPVLLAHEADDPAIKELIASRLWQTGNWRGAAQRYGDLLKTPTPEAVEQSLHFFASLDPTRTADPDEKQALDTARQNGVKQALAALDALSAPDALKHAIRGSYEAQNNHADAAIAELNAAVKLDPANSAFRRRLITVLLSAGKIPDALAAAADAVKIAPNDPACQALELLAASDGRSKTSPLDDMAIREYVISGLLASAVNQDMRDAAELLQSGRGNPKDLAVQLRLLADRNRASVALQVLAIRKLMTAGAFADALTLSRRAMLDYPAENQPASLAAFCAAQLGKWDEAQADILQWKSTSGGGAASHSLEADLILAMSDLRQGHANDAIAVLAPDDASTPAAHPDHKTLVMLLTLARIQARQFDEASARLWPEVMQNPGWRDDWARIAVDQIPVRDSQGQWHNLDIARAWLEKLSAAAAPTDIEGQSIAGMAWYNFAVKTADASAKATGYQFMRSAAAVMQGEKSLRGRAAMILATACEADGDLPGATANYRAALALDPELHPAANNLALVLARTGQNLAEAESLARQAISSDPQAATYDDSLAFILRKERKFDDALAAISKAVALEKSNPEWLVSQAEIQLDAGQTDKARDSLAQVDALASPSSLPQSLQDRYTKAKARASGNTLTQGF